MARLLAALLCALPLAACSSLHMNRGRLTAMVSATYAGEFRVDRGHWPTSASELEQYICRASGALSVVDSHEYPCAGPEPAPYRTELRSRGENLDMTLFDAAQRPICRLHLLAPETSGLGSMMVVRTTVFSCPGDGQELE
jgi:hypothetical protein